MEPTAWMNHEGHVVWTPTANLTILCSSDCSTPVIGTSSSDEPTVSCLSGSDIVAVTLKDAGDEDEESIDFVSFIVTVPTTGPVADHVIAPELTVVPPVAVKVMEVGVTAVTV